MIRRNESHINYNFRPVQVEYHADGQMLVIGAVLILTGIAVALHILGVA